MMVNKTKKKVFIIEGDNISYVGSVTDKNISMKFSSSNIWNESIKDTPIGELIDTGNHIKIKTDDVDLKLDYDDFVELFLLMKMKMKFDKDLTGDFKILTKRK